MASGRNSSFKLEGQFVSFIFFLYIMSKEWTDSLSYLHLWKESSILSWARLTKSNTLFTEIDGVFKIENDAYVFIKLQYFYI